MTKVTLSIASSSSILGFSSNGYIANFFANSSIIELGCIFDVNSCNFA